ncbi:MAG: TrmJ/YjtD family RNA methyltransferase [Caldilineales bacterium]|nr:TrmJ/YjtD family RNA methyltransferase [Caldilineales bacterium]
MIMPPPILDLPSPDASASPGQARGSDIALEHITVVLVQPQNPDNIGGVVRAMLNMGLKRLRLVQPATFSRERITAAAHRSEAFQAGIEVYDDLAAALADCNLVVTASRRQRRLSPRLLTPRQLAPIVLEHTRSGYPAILFGREDWGLPGEIVDQAHYQLVIPADAAYASLNLAQAVLLTAYELRQAALDERISLPDLADPADPPATDAELTAAIESLHRALQAARFYKPGQEPAKRIKLGRLLRRATPTSSEAGLLRAMGYVLGRAFGVEE